MAKMTIMQGLPASGKSTLAKELLAKGGTVRINKDLLRTMLHFDKFTGINEGLTQDASKVLAETFLTRGVNVIIDDTNLNPKTVQGWKELAKSTKSKIEYQDLKTSMEECLVRDASREVKVGSHVIVGMALTYGRYPNLNNPVVLCDLDGTLCNIKHRLHHVKGDKKKDWDSFFAGIAQDTLNTDVHLMLNDYRAKGRKIFFISARPEKFRMVTEQWLAWNGATPYEALFMRANSDARPDTEIKSAMYDKYFSRLPVEAVIDDRPSVIRMWQNKGLNVVDVGEGVEF